LKKQEVSFKSDNLNLYGELYFPTPITLNNPALIICHGIPAVPHNPAERGYAELAETFCTNGFITLIFNFRGSGQSQGNFDLNGWTQDLKSAIDSIYSFDDVKKSRLALMGSSGGAAVSICVAAADPRISSLVTLACPAELDFIPRDKSQELIAYFRKIGVIKDTNFPPSLENWLDGFNAVSPLRYIHHISPRPLLLIHGDQDNIVPIEHAHRLYKQAQDPKELVIIPGAGHRLRLEEKAVDTALKWLKLQSK
jgi:dipeptidyl aminopeptidase/acylaminoacyl peptidase